MVSWKSVSNWLTILILGMVCLPEAQPFSPETCRSICHVSSMICWFCESLHGSAQRDDLSTEYNDADYDFEDTEIVTQRRNRWLKAPSANELLKRGMISQKRQQKIVGGTTVRHGEEAPWTVGIKGRNGRSFYNFCGGTLVTDRHVITAAHCVDKLPVTKVYVSIGDWSRALQDPGEILSAVTKITIHPEYDTLGDFHADIAVIELAQQITFDRYKRPAAIALTSTKYQPFKDKFLVTGWGTKKSLGEHSSHLLKVTVPYVSFKHCQDQYKDVKPVTRGMLCAGNSLYSKERKDSCQGDSGGPLVSFRTDQVQPINLQDFEEKDDIEDIPEFALEKLAKIIKAVNASSNLKIEDNVVVENSTASVKRNDYIYRSFQYDTPEDVTLGDPIVPESEEDVKEADQNEKVMEKEDEEKDPHPFSRLLWSAGTSSSPTRMALQSMINAGIEASILNALAHLKQIQQQRDKINSNKITHNFNWSFLSNDDQEKKNTDAVNALRAFYEAFTDYQMQRGGQGGAVLPVLKDEFFGNGVPTLVGVVSWGYGCAMTNYAGVYTDIRYYRKWIIDQIGGEPRWVMVG